MLLGLSVVTSDGWKRLRLLFVWCLRSASMRPEAAWATAPGGAAAKSARGPPRGLEHRACLRVLSAFWGCAAGRGFQVEFLSISTESAIVGSGATGEAIQISEG